MDLRCGFELVGIDLLIRLDEREIKGGVKDDFRFLVFGMSNWCYLLGIVDYKWNSFGKKKSLILVIIILEVFVVLKWRGYLNSWIY